MMHPTRPGLALLLVVSVILSGCGRNNGLPAELTEHLAQRGIQLAPVRMHAPPTERGGYIVARYTPATVTNIVATFKLERIPPDNRQWDLAIDKAGGAAGVTELWGITGRPAQFKLRSGAQLEFFYLIVTRAGLMYLVAEYAYG